MVAMNNIKRFNKVMANLFVIGLCSTTLACSTHTGLSQESKNLLYPTSWQSISTSTNNPLTLNSKYWLTNFNDHQLVQLVEIALQNNRTLKVQRISMELAKERAIVSGASRFPDLNLKQTNSRRKSVSENGTQYDNNAGINLELSYELDIWGKLSEQQNQATLNYASAKSTFEQQKIELVQNVSSAWYSLVEAQQLLRLFEERASNLTNNLEMIQASYRLGLNQALDVYLTQNDVSRELARVAEQKQVLTTRKRQLELMLGQYPKGVLSNELKLPFINGDINLETPEKLLSKRHDILSSWYQLLALDAGLAVAHKQRFPRIDGR